MKLQTNYPFKAISIGDNSHFFGYFDNCPWNTDEKQLLGHRVSLPHRPPEPLDVIELGIFDLTKSEPVFSPFAATTAWNYQQGAMLQWCGRDTVRVAYNKLNGRQAHGVIKDLQTGIEIQLEYPIAALSQDGKQALSLNFGRLNWARPGYGYAGLDDLYVNDALPTTDGLFYMDIKTGDNKLLLSLPEIAAVGFSADMDNAKHFINHASFSPSGQRICFIHLYKLANGDVRSRLMAAHNDGSGLQVLIRGMASHFTWLSEQNILCWAGDRRILDSGQDSKTTKGLKQYVPVDILKQIYRILGKPRWLMYRLMNDRYYIFNIETGERKILAEGVLAEDGHCTVSPDGRWVCVDTYPNARRKVKLGLYDLLNEKYHLIAILYSPSCFEDETRCDLHPRWSPSGRELCIDSAHTGLRQIYTIDVSSIICIPPQSNIST